ncbi:MAG TPA: DUF4240 domain-containing protein [Nannocystaceae bacterium]|nr:DUF4240 domain-containing protein [Nannocystaceae bacterium]
MDEAAFWAIIAALNWKRAGDGDAVMAPAVKALAKLAPADIVAFDDMLAAKLFALDGVVFAREIGQEAYRRPGEYFSGESFLFARCCAVAKGRELYESILADPRRMPKDEGFEALLELATLAYEKKTGEDYAHVPTPDCETFANEAGWPRPQ